MLGKYEEIPRNTSQQALQAIENIKTVLYNEKLSQEQILEIYSFQ